MNGYRRGDVARRVSAASIAALAVSLGLACGASAAAGSGGQGALVVADASDDMRGRWGWPVSPPLITVAYRAPAHAYGPGHRGIDLSSDVGADVRAPDDGIVAFAGVVVDRPLITIDHGDGLVSTMEPVHAGVPVGARVQRGEWVGTVGLGGHSTPGDLHLGARRDDVYLNPLRLLGGLPRAVLLPCCEVGQDPG
ncbi:murein hydrolase activator EnvC [uncultured Microbacterium sp.]|uniref:murein hydrolase activator EnvC family protein n=1 Tax=uncultured Microbacterium sp. TaxID=191216 RepID=UPI0025F391DA|nr:M23 family metallopeptidase [uncultured Microbacterium sp.]